MTPNSIYKIEGKNLLKADHLAVKLNCDYHTWMGGWIRVFDHPYFALTDENGAFNMPDPPAGKYRLKVWHPASGWLGGQAGKVGTLISIEAGQVTDVGKMTIEMKKEN